MLPFRNIIPKHQVDRAVCEKYSSYLETLKIDFNRRCGYCNDVNKYRMRNFAIDHFVPRNPKDFTHDIVPNYYKNLIYTCNYCNSAKSNKWPTKNAAVFNDGTTGFVKPTDLNYDAILCRETDGTIISTDDNPLGLYIIRELNLKNPIHSLTWRLEKIIMLTEEVHKKIQETNEEELIKLKNELLQEYYNIIQNIFNNND